MDEQTARGRLATMTAWDQAPALTEDDLDELVIVAARMDASGIAPGVTGWAPTYELSAGAAEGWRWKAARVSGAFDFVSDGQRFDRSQMHAMCLQMADHYRKRLLVSARVRSNQPIVAPPIVRFAVTEESLP